MGCVLIARPGSDRGTNRPMPQTYITFGQLRLRGGKSGDHRLNERVQTISRPIRQICVSAGLALGYTVQMRDAAHRTITVARERDPSPMQ